MENTDYLLGLIIGIIIGFIFTMLLIIITAVRAIGFGLGCADTVLNNPHVSIDTTYTIHQQDTIPTYHFIKDR